MPVPSTSFTVRPRQRQPECARLLSSRPVSRVSAVIICAGNVNADRGSRRARIDRPSVRLLDLEELHVNPLRMAR